MGYSYVNSSAQYTIDLPGREPEWIFVDVEAVGGTRRQRAAGIAARMRGKGFERFAVSYSETPGFQTATSARYRKPITD
ncbi:hypothetical protein [Pseudonocardia sp. NPDC049154]|uniref:hypothetical protein n=1 Tax=Pseudonocardia sp. NPDC049154 TaxID=3155501 RepID=UPI003404EE42